MFNDNAFNVIHRQIPPPPIRIKYIALLFHGCGRRAMSFYYSPEGVKITQELLDNNYVSGIKPILFVSFQFVVLTSSFLVIYFF